MVDYEDSRPLVLAVDDDEVVAHALRRLQRDSGHAFRYESVYSCQAALARAQSRDVAAVLADYMLPDGLGTDLVPLLRHVPVVVMTSHGSEQVAVEALRAGASDYLIKDSGRVFMQLIEATMIGVLSRWRARPDILAQGEPEPGKGAHDFAALVVSTLSGPLQRVQHHCANLTRPGLEPVDIAGDARAARRAGQLAEGVLADLLEYTRISKGESARDTVEHSKLVKQVVNDIYSNESSGEAKLEVAIRPLPATLGDVEELRNLWFRLLRRARRRNAGRDLHVEIDAERRHEEWLFRVADDGEGLSELQLGSLGHPAMPTAATDPEMALDVGICRRIVEEHGGRLWLQSEGGRGVCVTFTLEVVYERGLGAFGRAPHSEASARSKSPPEVQYVRSSARAQSEQDKP